MKITKIHLKNYLNFEEEFEIDLVYPKGHNDEGKPLKKICFLGQSATGKTTLLNLIKLFSFENHTNQFSLDQDSLHDQNVGVEFLIEESKYKFSKWSKDNKDKTSSIENVELIYKDKSGLISDECKKIVNEKLSIWEKEKKVKLISFPFDVIRNAFDLTKLSSIDVNNPTYKGVIQKPESEGKSISEKIEEYLRKIVWDFSSDQITWLWEIVRDEINQYELKKIRYKDDTKKVKQWDKNNPLNKVAKKCINPILQQFNLKVNTSIDSSKNSHKDFIRLQHINDNVEISFTFSSTGTKQIILTALPFSILDFNKAIILFDEPERSLYPDTQVGLIKKYISLVPKSQFFFATHSPFVASAFEPWEIIELKFNRTNSSQLCCGVAVSV